MLLIIILSIAVIALLIWAVTAFLFRENPDYVLNHLKKYPESSSLYIAENGEILIAYQADVVRPLASTVKIIITVEYAMQVDGGNLTKDQLVAVNDLNRHYYKGTDGGGHEAWLTAVREAGKITDGQVPLHEVVKGMITYSSNANTDYLMHLLGLDAINKSTKTLELNKHEEVYPIVSPLLFSNHLKKADMEEKQLIKLLEAMPTEDYRALAKELSKQLHDGTINLEKYKFDSSLDVQRVWSDRLIGDSAEDYGKLLAFISSDKLPGDVSEIVRDVLEWPLEVNEKNQELFLHLGSKGGSTAFILNDAMYMENHAGEKIEMVIFTNTLNMWQQLQLSKNLNTFEVKIFTDEKYRQHVQKELSGI